MTYTRVITRYPLRDNAVGWDIGTGRRIAGETRQVFDRMTNGIILCILLVARKLILGEAVLYKFTDYSLPGQGVYEDG